MDKNIHSTSDKSYKTSAFTKPNLESFMKLLGISTETRKKVPSSGPFKPIFFQQISDLLEQGQIIFGNYGNHRFRKFDEFVEI